MALKIHSVTSKHVEKPNLVVFILGCKFLLKNVGISYIFVYGQHITEHCMGYMVY